MSDRIEALMRQRAEVLAALKSGDTEAYRRASETQGKLWADAREELMRRQSASEQEVLAALKSEDMDAYRRATASQRELLTEFQALTRVRRERQERQELQAREELQVRQELQARQAILVGRPPRAPTTAPTRGDRDRSRRARPRLGALPSGGDDEPDPLLPLLNQLVSVTVALRDQIAATRGAPRGFQWIPHRESPIPVRTFTSFCRELLACGDERAAKQGRMYYLRRSALDEFLRGAPQPKRAASTFVPEQRLSPLERFERELDLAIAEAAE